ncbi:unnamed protein product [Rhizophagus irregularis]|uniref:Uncharacterized protein n=1 Tax=Rhizophagus irregularis TaxID=588596 RepID=A0A915Z0L9_9GLOM|nr:unnamed protein product [Rhizophagus irregularis]CAB5356322.1 unnamed protein product [Rhizophagus irregularis]
MNRHFPVDSHAQPIYFSVSFDELTSLLFSNMKLPNFTFTTIAPAPTTTATPDISLTASIHAPAQGELNIPLQ